MTNHCNCRRRTQAVSRHVSRPALCFAGSLLLCAHPASAQTIAVNSGTATVSGTGTTVVGAGTTFGSGANAATTHYAAGEARGDGFFDASSTLNLQNGGSIQNVTTASGGLANIAGGSVGNATAGGVNDYGQINISGGTVQNASTGDNGGQVVISGGMVQNADSGTGVSSINDSLIISGGTVGKVTIDRAGVSIQGGIVGSIAGDDPNSVGAIHVSGGNVQSIDTPSNIIVSAGTVNTANASTSQVTGGTIQTLNLNGSGSISGGTIKNFNVNSEGDNTKISGGKFQFLTVSGVDNIINITGTGLEEIGTPTDAFGTGVFHLIGTLTDGAALNAQYTQNPPSISNIPSGELEFNGVPAVATPVPEASTAGSLAFLLLLSGAGLAFRAYKRRAV